MSGEKKTIRLRCSHCGYEWGYGGSAPFYASCPRCHYNVRISASKVEEKKEGL